MIRVLHVEHAFSDRFMTYMLSRNIRIEEDLIDQLFNSSEKRLARTLLLLARYGKEPQPQGTLPKVSQELLAEMIGTTRSRVNFFMNKFRKLGFIHYNGGLQVHSSLLSVVLHEGRGRHQHFLGFWARLNCEHMPVIPAWLVRSNLNDPRKIPYLLVWKDARRGEIMEAVRLARYVEPSNSRVTDNYVELKRTDGSFMILRIVWRMLPRNGGRALLLMCAYCNTPRRHVYGWEWDSVSVPFYNAFARWTNGLESNTSETLVPKVIRKHYAIAWSNAQRSQLTLQNQLVTRACG